MRRGQAEGTNPRGMAQGEPKACLSPARELRRDRSGILIQWRALSSSWPQAESTHSAQTTHSWWLLLSSPPSQPTLPNLPSYWPFREPHLLSHLLEILGMDFAVSPSPPIVHELPNTMDSTSPVSLISIPGFHYHCHCWMPGSHHVSMEPI